MQRRHAVLLGLLLTAPALALPDLDAAQQEPAAPQAPSGTPVPEPPAPGPMTRVALPAFPPARALAPTPAPPGAEVQVRSPLAAAGPAATVPAPPPKAMPGAAPVGASSIPVPRALPELPLCDAPLGQEQLPPGMLFLVETRLPGQAPRITPAVPFLWNPVDADGVLLDATGLLGIDLLVQVLPDLTFGEFTIRIVHASLATLDELAPELLDQVTLDEAAVGAIPGAGNLARPIPAMEVRLVLALGGGPEPGLVPQGCERPFLAAGYAYDHGLGQPDRFEVVVDLERLDAHDLYAESRLRLEGAGPRLDLLLEVYDAMTYHAERPRTLDVRATLHDLPPVFSSLLVVDTSTVDEAPGAVQGLGLPGLPPPLDGLLAAADAAAKATATAFDWRAAAALPRVTVVVHRHDAASATDVRIEAAPLPGMLSEVLTTGAATTVTHDAAVPIDVTLALEQWSRDGQGAATLRSTALVEVEGLPLQALFHLDRDHVDYAGSAPLGSVAVVQGNHRGPFPVLPGEHLLIDRTDPARSSLSLRAEGILEAHWRDGPVRALDVLLEGGRPFEVQALFPDRNATVHIAALPSAIELRSDFATMLRYRADAVIPSMAVHVETANLTMDLHLLRLPRSVDVMVGERSAEVTLSEPLGGLVADLHFPHGLADLAYDRIHAEASGIPGLAASWDDAGGEVGVQALPPGSAIGSVLVQLSSDDLFLAPEGDGAFVGAENATAQRATIRALGLERTLVDLRGGVDLLYESASAVPLDVFQADGGNVTRVAVHNLPDRVRLLTDKKTLFSYEGSDEIATLSLSLTEEDSGNQTFVDVQRIPRSLLLLLHLGQGHGSIVFDTGGSVVGSATAELVRPAGLGDNGLRHGRVHLQSIPGVHIGWEAGEVAFRTTTGSLGLLEAELSSLLPMATWTHPEDVDRIVFFQEFPLMGKAIQDGKKVPDVLHIHARVEGLREASARSSGDRVVGDVKLHEARPFDVRYQRIDGPCLTADADLKVRDLPSFRVDTDLGGTVVYDASQDIGNVTLHLVQERRGIQPGTCQPKEETRIEVHGVPRHMTASLSLEPISAWFESSGPIGAVGVDLLRPADPVKRMRVNVTDIPSSLAATVDEARQNLLFEAREPVGEVRVVASTEAELEMEMDQQAFDQASAALVVRDELAATGRKTSHALRLVGLRSAALSLVQGALESSSVIAPGPIHVDLLARDGLAEPPRANHTRIDTEGASRTYRITALPDERVVLDTDQGFRWVVLRQCEQGEVFDCQGNDTLLFLFGVPPWADVRLTGRGAELDLGTDELTSFFLRRITTEAPWDPKAIRGSLTLTLMPVTSGHAHYRDPGQVDVRFAEPARLHLDLRSNRDFGVPFSDVHTDPWWDLDHYAAGVWTEASRSIHGLGRDPYKAVAVNLGLADGEGVRAVRVHLDSNPVLVAADWNIPQFTFLDFESPVLPVVDIFENPILPWPKTHLGLTDPPERFELTLEDRALVYPPEAYSARPWAYGKYHPERIPPDTEGGPNAQHKHLRFDTLGSAAKGDLHFSFSVPVERDQAYFEGPTQPETFLAVRTAVPAWLEFDLYLDPWVWDPKGKDNEGEAGAYLGVNIEMPERQALEAYASFPGDWFVQMGGRTKQLFFDVFRPFDPFNEGHKPKNRMWVHLSADANMQINAKRDMDYAWDAAQVRPVLTYDADHYRFAVQLQDVRGTFWISTEILPQSCRHMSGDIVAEVFYDKSGTSKWTLTTNGWGPLNPKCLATITNDDPWEVDL